MWREASDTSRRNFIEAQAQEYNTLYDSAMKSLFYRQNSYDHMYKSWLSMKFHEILTPENEVTKKLIPRLHYELMKVLPYGLESFMLGTKWRDFDETLGFMSTQKDATAHELLAAIFHEITKRDGQGQVLLEDYFQLAEDAKTLIKADMTKSSGLEKVATWGREDFQANFDWARAEVSETFKFTK